MGESIKPGSTTSMTPKLINKKRRGRPRLTDEQRAAAKEKRKIYNREYQRRRREKDPEKCNAYVRNYLRANRKKSGNPAGRPRVYNDDGTKIEIPSKDN